MGHGKRPVDYGMAEALALRARWSSRASRSGLTGQDSRRGTFNQRHSVLIDIENDEEYVPLAHVCRARAGAGRDLQLGALRGGGAGLRVRLQPRLSGGAGALGGAVRRLRQRRADHHRPVHQRRRGQVGPALGRGPAASARLRGAGAGAFQRPHRALSAALRRGQHAGLPAVHGGAILPSAAAAGAAAAGASR